MEILILKNDVRFVFIPYSLFCFIYVMDFFTYNSVQYDFHII